MNDVLTQKGYSARIEFDAADRVFFERMAKIDDGVGFRADGGAGSVRSNRQIDLATQPR